MQLVNAQYWRIKAKLASEEITKLSKKKSLNAFEAARLKYLKAQFKGFERKSRDGKK